MIVIDSKPSDKARVSSMIAKASVASGSLLGSGKPDANGALPSPPNQLNESSIATRIQSMPSKRPTPHEANE